MTAPPLRTGYWLLSFAVPAPIRVAALLLVVLVVAGCAPAGQPEAIVRGREIYGDYCSVCHGNRGQGGVGPALEAVRETWPSCTDHREWVSLGSEGWKAEHGGTYGAFATPITSVMPPHAESLTPGEIAFVAAFERYAYGGASEEQALRDCGL